MIEWILVFWLQYPGNYTVYAKYQTERECRDAEQLWRRRLHIVGSDIKAECRKSG